jgi:hypothetical protein
VTGNVQGVVHDAPLASLASAPGGSDSSARETVAGFDSSCSRLLDVQALKLAPQIANISARRIRRSTPGH